jgi:hypothetical protein
MVRVDRCSSSLSLVHAHSWFDPLSHIFWMCKVWRTVREQSTDSRSSMNGLWVEDERSVFEGPIRRPERGE